MKKMVWLGALSLFIFGAAGSSSAMDGCCTAEHKDVSKTAQNKIETADAGNKICPVTGEKINEKTKGTYEYKGKTYNFCCPMCIDEFKKNPEKNIEKIEKGT